VKKIGLLSDTHGYLDERIRDYFKDCDEIWHAGDIGTVEVLETLESQKPVKAVYGNIDGQKIRLLVPEIQRFDCEGMDVMIKHIGGYPGRYDRSVREIITNDPPDIFIAGHSHILKVQNDKKNNLLHINPGAAGKTGLHKVSTVIKFIIDSGRVKDLEVFEIGRRY
jgi:putative phosphoesterase